MQAASNAEEIVEHKYNYFRIWQRYKYGTVFNRLPRGEGVKFLLHTADGGQRFIPPLSVPHQNPDVVVPNDEPAVTIHGMLAIPDRYFTQEYSRRSYALNHHNPELAGNAQMRLMPENTLPL